MKKMFFLTLILSLVFSGFMMPIKASPAVTDEIVLSEDIDSQEAQLESLTTADVYTVNEAEVEISPGDSKLSSIIAMHEAFFEVVVTDCNFTAFKQLNRTDAGRYQLNEDLVEINYGNRAVSR
jgi:hypothetical protein